MSKESDQALIRDWMKAHPEANQQSAKPTDTSSTVQTVRRANAAMAKEKVEKVETPREPLSDMSLMALSGNMGSHSYYVVAMKLKDVAERLHFAEDDYEEDTPPEEQYQRKLNRRRITESLIPYLDQDGHFFPPLVATATDAADCQFHGGHLHLKGAGKFPVIDGQHRLSGIQGAIEKSEDDVLKNETIGVVFMPNLDVAERQQLFSDLNRNAKLPAKAIGILYDHRDLCAIVARSVADHGVLSGKVNMSTNVLSKKSDDIVTLGVLYEMVRSFVMMQPDSVKSKILKEAFKDKNVEEITDIVFSYFDNIVIPSLPNLSPVAKGIKDAAGVNRATFVCYTSLGWQAIARAVAMALQFGLDSDTIKERLANLNWAVDAPIWKPILDESGKVLTRKNTIQAAIAIVQNALSPQADQKVA